MDSLTMEMKSYSTVFNWKGPVWGTIVPPPASQESGQLQRPTDKTLTWVWNSLISHRRVLKSCLHSLLKDVGRMLLWTQRMLMVTRVWFYLIMKMLWRSLWLVICRGGVKRLPASMHSTLEVGSVTVWKPGEVLMSKREITFRLFQLTWIKT